MQPVSCLCDLPAVCSCCPLTGKVCAGTQRVAQQQPQPAEPQRATSPAESPAESSLDELLVGKVPL